MPTNIESSGKTLDEAIRSGLSVLGVEREAVTVEILSKPKTGFFGIGTTPAKVKLTLAVPEKPSAKRSDFDKANNSNTRTGGTPRVSSPTNKVEKRPASNTAAAPQKEWNKQSERLSPPVNKERTRREHTRRPTAPALEADRAKAQEFIDGLLKCIDMGLTAVTEIKDDIVAIGIEGDNVGNLIGRHGETLDAVQHIVTNAVNLKRDGDPVRIQVDAADYRGKRQAALEQLARRMADNAKRYNSNMTLEPMNAYERHVIHVTLQDMPGITTFSTGTDPQRRVVISSVNARRGRNDRGVPRGGNRSNSPGDRTNRDGYRKPYDNQGHTNNPRPAAFKAEEKPAPAVTPPPTAEQPRSLPVKEFGVKKK